MGIVDYLPAHIGTMAALRIHQHRKGLDKAVVAGILEAVKGI